MKARFVITEYTVPTTKSIPAMTVALVSDLHERDPEPILELLRQAQPDLICAAGDILERHAIGSDPRHRRLSRRKRCLMTVIGTLHDLLYLVAGNRDKGCVENGRFFLKAAGEIAPVFLSLGNHEWYLTAEDWALMQASRVTLLDNSDCQWGSIRIGGLSSCADEGWLAEFRQKHGYKLLLCHHPEYYDRYALDSFDLVLSGHAHGGQWRIAGRGVLAPDQGLLPKYTHGIYDGRLVVSAGCANTTAFPRLGNPCEVVVLKLRPQRI